MYSPGKIIFRLFCGARFKEDYLYFGHYLSYTPLNMSIYLPEWVSGDGDSILAGKFYRIGGTVHIIQIQPSSYSVGKLLYSSKYFYI